MVDGHSIRDGRRRQRAGRQTDDGIFRLNRIDGRQVRNADPLLLVLPEIIDGPGLPSPLNRRTAFFEAADFAELLEILAAATPDLCARRRALNAIGNALMAWSLSPEWVRSPAWLADALESFGAEASRLVAAVEHGQEQGSAGARLLRSIPTNTHEIHALGAAIARPWAGYALVELADLLEAAIARGDAKAWDAARSAAADLLAVVPTRASLGRARGKRDDTTLATQMADEILSAAERELRADSRGGRLPKSKDPESWPVALCRRIGELIEMPIGWRSAYAAIDRIRAASQES